MNLFFSVARSPLLLGTATFQKQPHGDQAKVRDPTRRVPRIRILARSPVRAGELLFQKRVVGRACFLAFEPLQVLRNPRVMACTRRARVDIRPKEAMELSLGALPVHARLPLPGLLMAMLPVGQLPKLLASFGIGDDP